MSHTRIIVQLRQKGQVLPTQESIILNNLSDLNQLLKEHPDMECRISLNNILLLDDLFKTHPNVECRISQTEIIIKLNSEPKQAKGEAFLIQALVFLNDALIFDKLFETHPNLVHIKKYFDSAEAHASKTKINSNPDLLIKQAKFLLNAAELYGNKDAINLLKILNTTDLALFIKTDNQEENLLSPHHECEQEKMNPDADPVITLNGQINIIDNYVQSPMR